MLNINLSDKDIETILYACKGPCRTPDEREVCAKIRRALTRKKKKEQ